MGSMRKFLMIFQNALYAFVCIFGITAVSTACAQDIVDEDAMFADDATVVAAPGTSQDEQASLKNKKFSFGVSGEVESVNDYSLIRSEENFIHEPGVSDSILLNNLYFDARYQTYYKIFANLQSSYSHYWDDADLGTSLDQDDATSDFKEFFVDTPIQNKIYLRWGKQVLQWGRTRLWNPTDLINIDRNTFVERTGSKSGVYGVRLHIPQGTTYNFYGFLDTGRELESDELGGALKFEALVGSTEMAVSFWNKHEYLPVYGYDVSSRMFNVDINAEASVSQRFGRAELVESGGVLYEDRLKDEWKPRVSVNLAKDFKVNDQPQKLNLSTEFFYNGAGYKDNIFRDDHIYAYRDPLDIGGTLFPAGDKQTLLLKNGLYEPNYYGRYYLAFFSSIRKFITSSFTLSNNWVGNLSDGSSIFSTSLGYANIKDWYVSTTVYVMLGPERSEYTLGGQALSAQVRIGYKF